MATKLKKLIDAEAKASEVGEADQSSRARVGVKVTRGHDRAKTVQIRLSHEELGELTALAEACGTLGAAGHHSASSASTTCSSCTA